MKIKVLKEKSVTVINANKHNQVDNKITQEILDYYSIPIFNPDYKKQLKKIGL